MILPTPFLLDTHSVSRFRLGQPTIVKRVLSTPPQRLATSVITVEEQLNGWYAQLRQVQNDDERLADVYSRIAQTIEALAQFRILTFDLAAIASYHELQALRLNIGKMALRIGAIALTQGATVVTSNVRDFSRIPGLLWEDWAKPSELPS